VTKNFRSAINKSSNIKPGAAGLALLPKIYTIDDVDVLKTIFGAIKTTDSPDDLRCISLCNAG